ncbi:hypothetical protein AALC17_12880 [Oscillospiraceae bacterium 38-13]
MGILEIAGHLGSFVTLVSGIRDAVQAGFKFYKPHKLKKLCGTVDFSSLSEELAPIADQVERYLAGKKSDILGDSLFSSEEKAEFIEEFFIVHSDTLPYRSDVEPILLDYITRLESCLLQQMSVGEKVIHGGNQRIEENTKQILAKIDALASCGSSPPYAFPDAVFKVFYDIPSDYIPRKVIPHAVAMLDIFERAFQDYEPLTLTDALSESDHLLVLSDAGHGKSIELQNLAGVLYKTSKFPFLCSLNLYCGEPICALLPEAYRTLPAEYLVLLFDGYDEMQEDERDEFMRRLQSFIKDHPSVKVVVSSRSNFCKAEIENQSQTFRDFRVFDLDDLTDTDIQGYLFRQAVDTDCFMAAVKQSDTGYLLQNPFYLARLVRLYQEHGQLPSKTEVMDYLITESFQLDGQKFQGDLEERRRDLFVLLEKAAFSMQLMQTSVLDDVGEYQELFGLEDRKLLKYSGLLRKEGTRWRFSHNNFKEYLAAKFLSTLPREDAIRYFSDGQDIKMSWVNTFGFFVSIAREWDVKSWALEHIPSALVKFEPDHLELDVRVSIFKTIFLEREEKMLWLSDSLFNLEQLAVFACCEESLEFLLDKIRQPVHRVSQISAIHLLKYFPRLFGRQSETAQALLVCCTAPVNGNEGLCYNALEALSSLKLVTSEIAAELTAKYTDCPNSQVRWGMYQLLTRSGQHNAHVQFFLDGIPFTHGNNRISNETIALVDGLKALTEPESIQQVLQYLSQMRPKSIYEEGEIFEDLCVKAAEQFSEGQTEYYQVLINCYISLAKHCSQREMRTIAHFFEATGTIENAVVELCGDAERYYDLDALFYQPENLTYVAKAYCDGKLKEHTLFQELVARHTDDAQYQEYKNLILQIDGITLPERKPHVDYERLEQARRQEYFELLFDKAKAEQLLLRSIEKTQFPNPTVKDLIHSFGKYEFGSLLMKLNYGLHRHVQESTKAKDAIQSLDWNRFVILEASLSIRNAKDLHISNEHKSVLRQMIQPLYEQGLLENAVTYNGASPQVSVFIVAVVSLTVYLELVPGEQALLRMTELPYFCFSDDDDIQKYTFLKAHLPEKMLLQRITENIKTQKVHGTVLRDHIQYCMNCGCEDIRQATVDVVEEDESARTAAIEYLYKFFGTYCIQEELLPFADENTLLNMERLCPDLSKEHLRIAMERQFQAAPSTELMAHLITLGSEMALREYIRLAGKNQTIPEKRNDSLSGPTQAISTLRNSRFLPLLEELMKIALSPDFQDGEFCSLRTNLSNALAVCGAAEPEAVMTILQSHQGTREENEVAFRFCSYTADVLKEKNRMRQDAPWKLSDVKRTLEAVS